MSYQSEFQRSIDDPSGFWLEKAERIAWYKKPTQGHSIDENGADRWFADGELNTCYLALDYHVENGRGEQTALIYDSPVVGMQRGTGPVIKKFSYKALRDEVAKVAGMLAVLGVQKGDRVVIYMPMIPEAVMAMLACARLGAIHSVVFGGFASHELAVRIDDAKPKVILSASCGIEVRKLIPYKPLIDAAIEEASHEPEHCVIVQRPEQECELVEGRDLEWASQVEAAEPADCVPVKATDPLYVLYTSGTTGKPKGVVRDNGGHAVALRYSMNLVYDMQPGDVYWAASDVGWVVGHSYIVYAPLITGCTTILYEGKPINTPDAGAFWRVMAEHKVKALFTAPTAFRAMKKVDPKADLLKDYDISSLKYLFMAGERLDPPTYEWMTEVTGVPVYDHWWQTETGWAICCNPVGLEPKPIKAGSATLPTPGYNVKILGEDGSELGANGQGYVVVKRPLPPSCLPTVWDDPQRFQESYMDFFPGYYLTGDGGYIDKDGYVFVMGRVDDVINVAGHRLSTGEMEELVGAHAAVAECAVIGVPDELKGEVPIGLAVLKDGQTISEADLHGELNQSIRTTIGPIACYDQTFVVKRLPKTRSGKILRRTLRQIAKGESYAIPSTIDDPVALEEIDSLMKSR